MPAGEQCIAEIGDRSITKAEILCPRDLFERKPKWLRGRTVEEMCREVEQDNFRGLAIRALLEAACALEQCEPTDAEKDPFRSPILRSEEQLRQLAELGLQIPRAVARVYQGEPLDEVYAEVIAPQGHELEGFRREVEMYRSLDVVERFLAKDHVALARRSFEDGARQRAIRANLRKRVAAVAQSSDRELEDAADDYLKRLVERIGVRLFDPLFELPTGREVFL